MVSPKRTRRHSQELSEASPDLKSPRLTRRRSQECNEDSSDIKSPKLKRRGSQEICEKSSPQNTPKGDNKLNIIPEFEFDFIDDEPKHVVDECIKNLEQLKPSQMADISRRTGWSTEQHAALLKVWKLTWHPTVDQKYALVEKTGVPFENLRYYFDNQRRKYLKYWDRKNQAVKREKTTSVIVVNKESQEVKKKLSGPKKGKICSNFNEESLVESKLSIEEIIENGNDDLDDNPALAAVAKLASEGLPACVAYEEEGINYCNLCDFTYTTRQNLYLHLDKHGVEYR